MQSAFACSFAIAAGVQFCATMQATIREALANEIDTLVPILLLAEPSQSALRWSLSHMSDAVYRMDMDGVTTRPRSSNWLSSLSARGKGLANEVFSFDLNEEDAQPPK